MLQITNLTGQKINKAFLKRAADKASAVLGKNGLEEISLVLVGNAKIKALNNKYLHQNKVTDVLSFEELNEIFICLPQARRQAEALEHSLNCELTRLLVHGIVHLKGYEHERGGAQARRMEKIENRILKIS